VPVKGKQRWPAVAVFLLLFFSYSSVNGGWGYNQWSRLDLLHSIIVHGTLSIDQHQGNTGDKSFYGGHYYSDKAPGIAFLALPAYITSTAILKVLQVDLESEKAWQFSHWITTIGSVGLLAALGGAAFFALLRRWLTPLKAFVATMATFLGSLPFPYATMLFSHAGVIGLLSISLWAVLHDDDHCLFRYKRFTAINTFSCRLAAIFAGICLSLIICWMIALQGWFFEKNALRAAIPFFFTAFLLSIAVWLIFAFWIRHQQTKHKACHLTFDIIAGLSAGFAVSSEYTAGLAFLGFLILLLLRSRHRALCFAIASLLPLSIIPVYNYLCFGSPFGTSYSHVQGWEGMNNGLFGVTFSPSWSAFRALLISPSRGLFYWTPFFLLAPFGFVGLWKYSRSLAVISSLLVVGYVFSISSYAYWDGGMGAGPRHLASLIPFIGLLAAFGLVRWPRLGALLAFISIIMYSVAAFVDSGTPNSPYPLIDFYLPRLLTPSHEQNILSLIGLSPPASSLTLIAIIVLLVAESVLFCIKSQWKSTLSKYGPPILAILFAVTITAAAGYSVGINPLSATSYSRWDSGLYLSIAQDGYNVHPCGSIYCGNSAWFPAFPLLMRLVANVTGLGLERSGVIISHTALFFSLYLLWNFVLRNKSWGKRLLALFFAATFPGSIYFHAIFPVSLTVLLLLLSTIAFVNNRYLLAGIIGFFVGFSYSSGFLLGLVLPLALLFSEKRPKHLLIDSVTLGLLPLLGTLSVFFYQGIATGQWNAFFKNQSSYHYVFQNPFVTLFQGITSLLSSTSLDTTFFISSQSVFVFILLVIAAALVIFKHFEYRLRSFLLLQWLFFWSLPNFLAGSLSIYRSEALLLLAVVPLTSLSYFLLVPICLFSIFLHYNMSIQFFLGNIV